MCKYIERFMDRWPGVCMLTYILIGCAMAIAVSLPVCMHQRHKCEKLREHKSELSTEQRDRLRPHCSYGWCGIITCFAVITLIPFGPIGVGIVLYIVGCIIYTLACSLSGCLRTCFERTCLKLYNLRQALSAWRHRRNARGSNQSPQHVVISATVASAQLGEITTASTTFQEETELQADLTIWPFCKPVTYPATLKIVKKLIELNWEPELTGVGRDAIGLQHCGLQIRSVFCIFNKSEFTAYFKNYIKLKNRFTIPKELRRKPIATTALKDDEEYILQADEAYLFHGTDRLAAQNIAQCGFDIKYARNGAFGHPGIYFSEYSQKADQYADKSGRRSTDLYMIIARVALGKTELYKNKKSIETYDTVVGGTISNLFREFVKADTMQIYPMFIVNYDRS